MSEPLVLQSWTPLSQCLDWELGTLAWQVAGFKAFAGHTVPHLATQAGLGPGRAAEVFFAQCLHMERAGTLPARIVAVEYAAGLGLHAAQLLDRFERLCQQTGRDFADRLTFYVTDGTPQMVDDLVDRGVLSRHPGRAVAGLADLMEPALILRRDTGERLDLSGQILFAVHTYGLCALPSLPLQQTHSWRDGAVQARWACAVARTLLQDPERAADLTELSLPVIQALATAGGQQKLPLVALLPLLTCDIALAEVAIGDVDRGQVAEHTSQLLMEAMNWREPDGPVEGDVIRSHWLNLPGGALRALQAQLEALAPHGLLLYRDHGPATAAEAAEAHLPRHFGGPVVQSVDHFALDAWWTRPVEQGGAGAELVVPPGGDGGPLHTRLVGRLVPAELRAAFRLHFDGSAEAGLEQAVARARALTEAQDARAVEAYRAALAAERDNWLLLAEAGEVCLRHLAQPELARMFLSESLRVNPWYNASAWMAWADLAFAQQDREGARLASESASRSQPDHPRPWLALSELALDGRQWVEALEFAAKALARAQEPEAVAAAEEALRRARDGLSRYRELA